MGKRYVDLEDVVCDLRLRGHVIETFLSQTLKESRFAPKFGDNVTIVLLQEQIDALQFLIGEQQTQVLDLHKRFYADTKCEP
ncbi:hypothetical protein [Methylobacterium sp. J-070]|uniref:hypothetical protein n=1 Tax=Methylobacterium sp. J-070 TaxID=2836650 RepID=UPI001FB9A678|nr:hypothetical protein [Methylobacterium sp. J-070]MCJ2052335.1 hypothetical protein [Methylobacterium sp. J-070]